MISQMLQTVSGSASVNSKISQRSVGQLYLLLWPQTVYIFALFFPPARHQRESADQGGNGSSAVCAAGADLQPPGGTNDDQNGPE